MTDKDTEGTDHKKCEWYDNRFGVCQHPDCLMSGRQRCIGTRMCNNFWDWFLKANKLIRQ